MSPDTFLSLLAFAFVASVTPGPNNLMLLASGVNFGFRRTLPHMLGIALGFAALLLGVGFGIGALLETFPSMYLSLKIAGGTYLLYLAYRLATSRSIGAVKAKARPMTVFEAVAFQWVNPKAWIMALTAMAIYTDPVSPFLSVLLVTLAFMLVNVPCASSWTGFGTWLANLLADPRHLRRFNIAMGLLLAATLWPMLR